MQQFRLILNLGFSRVLVIAFAAYLLNFSIDSQDPYPDDVAENLAFNDIESVYEFFTETLMGIEDAVKEHEERDMDEGGIFSYSKFFYSSNTAFCLQIQHYVELSALVLVPTTVHLKHNFLRNINPPPEVWPLHFWLIVFL